MQLERTGMKRGTLEHAWRLKDLLFQEIKGIVGLSRAQQIELGFLLWEVSGGARNRLEPLKQVLRELAVNEIRPKTGPVMFKGSHRTACQVTVMPDEIRLRENADIEGLRALLGPDFSDYFETEVTYKPNHPAIKQLLETSDGADLILQKIVEAIEIVSFTPRVKFDQE